VDDSQCVEFLQWALPRLGLRWAGYRKVRGQVCRRLRRRLVELELPDLAAYRAHLEHHPDEWRVLDGLTRITISRFNRDRGVFACLEREVIPALASDIRTRGIGTLKAWSAGCASGEEPYTLAIMWQLELAQRFPALELRILATDVGDAVLIRAREGCFASSSARELPDHWRASAFDHDDGGLLRLRDELRRPVTFARHDVRDEPPAGSFDLALCRNLAFTYYDEDGQRATAARLAGAIRAGGALVLGAHETLPADVAEFEPWQRAQPIYRRRSDDLSA
jgi:chemotaxis protein methyltransferase CheR